MTIGLISHGIDKSRSQRNLTTGVSGATIVIAPYLDYEMSVPNETYIDGMDKSLKNVRQCVKGGLVDQWVEEVQKFTGKNKLRVIQLYTANDIDEYTVREMIEADVIVVSSTILYDENYLAKLNKYSKTTNTTQKMGKIPKTMGAAPPEILEGFWIPYGRGTLYGAAQHTPIAADQLAYFHKKYSDVLKRLRRQKFKPNQKGVPLEWFLYQRVVIDEAHTALRPAHFKNNSKANAQHLAARELMGVHVQDIAARPLRAVATWCLTATAGMETAARVSELAHLCGITVTGKARHWRKHEMNSRLRMFLEMREGSPSLWYEHQCWKEAQAWLDGAAQRNEDQYAAEIGVQHETHMRPMTPHNMSSLQDLLPSFMTKFGPTCNPSDNAFRDPENWNNVLDFFATLKVRKDLLNQILLDIATSLKESQVNERSRGIFVVAPKGVAYEMATQALEHRKDVTTDPKTYKVNTKMNILLLATQEAAGLNLQGRGNHIVLFMPLWGDYRGRGAADREAQAIGRIHRNGQEAEMVYVHHVLVQGPSGEQAVDHTVQRRNIGIRATDKNQRLEDASFKVKE